MHIEGCPTCGSICRPRQKQGFPFFYVVFFYFFFINVRANVRKCIVAVVINSLAFPLKHCVTSVGGYTHTHTHAHHRPRTTTTVSATITIRTLASSTRICTEPPIRPPARRSQGRPMGADFKHNGRYSSSSVWRAHCRWMRRRPSLTHARTQAGGTQCPRCHLVVVVTDSKVGTPQTTHTHTTT